MDFYTKKWCEYIDKEWNLYVKSMAFFADFNSKNIEKYDGNFDDKLISEFDKYYNAKNRYVEMSSELKERFGDYEKIEIKSYEEELDEYKDRVNLYASELKEVIKRNIGEDKFSEIENIDFKLLLLGYVNSSDYDKIIKYCQKIYNRANGFLSGDSEYDMYLRDYIDKDFFDIWFHDCIVTSVVRKDNDLTLVIDDGYWPYDKVYYLTFSNCLDSDIEETELPIDILGLSVYYTNNKFYLYIDVSDVDCYEFVCDEILLDIKKK